MRRLPYKPEYKATHYFPKDKIIKENNKKFWEELHVVAYFPLIRHEAHSKTKFLFFLQN
jgi:hypothetical protein